MRLSIIVPVLNSHEIVRRQLLHYERMGLPDDTELILVDDGSDPPIENTSDLPVTILRTQDTRPWTWALARNLAARNAAGEYLLMYDLDHIVTRDLLEFVLSCKAPRIDFPREFAVLTEEGCLTQEREILKEYGLPPDSPLTLNSHQNSFAIRRNVFWDLKGYREDLVERSYPQGEDSDFQRRWKAYRDGKGLPKCVGPVLYHFPNGRFCGDVDYNPQNLFHSLSRKSKRNPYYKPKPKEVQECQTDLQKT